MKIDCPSCRVPVAAGDVNLATGFAKCRTCNSVFRFEAPRARPLAGKPQNLVMQQANGEMVVQFRWFSWKYLFLAFFCVMWFGFLAFWYLLALNVGSRMMLLLPLLHVAVGLFLAYSTVAGFINTTTLRIAGGRLSVRHQPLPWPGAVNLSTADVQQLYCEEKIVQIKGGTRRVYSLSALLRDGKRKKVVRDVDSPDLPIFLEQHAEAWMKIADAPVAGELAR